MKTLIALMAFAIVAFSTPYVTASMNVDHKHTETSSSTIEHSGGTDSNGCHHDRKRGGYHCH